MKAGFFYNMILCAALIFVGCAGENTTVQEVNGQVTENTAAFTLETPIDEVISDTIFDDYGRLIFPAQKGYYGGDELPQAGAVIMQYTGLNEYSESDPPTFACVGDEDGIANWRIMQARLDAMDAVGIDTEFHCYHGLGHGFGLGTGTDADGWIDSAVQFWEKQMK